MAKYSSDGDISARLQKIEDRINALTGDYGADTSDDLPILGSDGFARVAKQLREEFGSKADDKLENNHKIDAFLEEVGDITYYPCGVLLLLDPCREFNSFRSKLKLFLLPSFQLLVPSGMLWYFLVYQDLFHTNGICVNETNKIFRFVGCVTFLYSGWQIIDGCDDAASKTLLHYSVRHWSLTGHGESLRATFLFFLCNFSQQMCSLFILFLTYVIFTTQCDTPLDLLMNCVALNFVFDIDVEWMTDRMSADSKESAATLFKSWRDVCTYYEADVREQLTENERWRHSAPHLVKGLCRLIDTTIWALTYVLVIGWTFCPAEV
jgi:hypothetical protein